MSNDTNDSGEKVNAEMAQAHMDALRIVRPFVCVNYPNSDAKAGRFANKPQDYAAAVGLKRDTYFLPGNVRKNYPPGNPPHLADIGDGCRVAWGDFDDTPDIARLPAPSVVVQSSTKDKRHLYWGIADVMTADQLEQVNLAIIDRSNADHVWNRNRVMRLAGSWRPNPKNCMVHLLKADGPRYSSAELLALVTDDIRAKHAAALVSRDRASCSNIEWTKVSELEAGFMSQLPDLPPLAQTILENRDPFHVFNAIMSECWGRSYADWRGVLAALASTLKYHGYGDAETVALIKVWIRATRHPGYSFPMNSDGKRSNDVRQVERVIEYALSRAYKNDDVPSVSDQLAEVLR